MNEETINARAKELERLRDIHRQRLTTLLQDVEQSKQALAIIEGGLQDCQWWLAQIGQQEKTPAVNGEARKAAVPAVDNS
jgi:hypothetical protein